MNRNNLIYLILGLLGSAYLAVNLHAWERPELYTEIGIIAAAPESLWPALLFIIVILLPLGTVHATQRAFGPMAGISVAVLWGLFLVSWLSTDLRTVLTAEGWWPLA